MKLLKLKKFIASLKFPVFMKMQSGSALLIGIGLLIHEYANIKTTDIIMLMGFDRGWIEILALFFILSGLIFFFAYFIEFIIKLVYYLRNKNLYKICPNCYTDLFKTGFTRNHINLNYVEIVCKKCGYKIYRKGLF